MHQDDESRSPRDQWQNCRIVTARRDVVDRINAGIQRRVGYFGQRRVNRKDNRHPPTNIRQDRAQAFQLLGGADARCARPGGFGADVNPIRPIGDHRLGMF